MKKISLAKGRESVHVASIKRGNFQYQHHGSYPRIPFNKRVKCILDFERKYATFITLKCSKIFMGTIFKIVQILLLRLYVVRYFKEPQNLYIHFEISREISLDMMETKFRRFEKNTIIPLSSIVHYIIHSVGLIILILSANHSFVKKSFALT